MSNGCFWQNLVCLVAITKIPNFFEVSSAETLDGIVSV